MVNPPSASANVTVTFAGLATPTWLSTVNLDGTGSTIASTSATSLHKWIQGGACSPPPIAHFETSSAMRPRK